MTLLKEKLKSRKTCFGAWTSLSHPQITEMFCSIMQPDFLGIDVEHSTINQGEAQRIMAAGQANRVPVMPRAASHNRESIKRYLDSGADGIIVPMVNTKREVEEIVAWTKYTPIGNRSYGVGRAQGYGFHFDQYGKEWNDKSVIIIQIESLEGVEAIDKLLSNEHVDGVMIGPYDISGSLGVPGELENPKVLKACDRVIEACARFGVGCGTQDTNPSESSVRNLLDQGYTFVVLSSDIFLTWRWSEAMRGLIQRVREVS